MDLLADKVAETDLPPTVAGRELGWPQSSTARVWRAIVASLGWQAA